MQSQSAVSSVCKECCCQHDSQEGHQDVQNNQRYGLIFRIVTRMVRMVRLVTSIVIIVRGMVKLITRVVRKVTRMRRMVE